ncbi:hypothetical protein LAG90_16080 [Marinilongibacter aquaticus]|uniref:hypothetical protein n=1 Tax=Marinilongibacter aquaticus TaxID=2975157 RepID=UPI0021BD409B|nr:hypothetical protein [Marinilongibacter aquaticus]UBM58322.1 hypothetical protein LAG90_16080 [Marinilongibacter aquaticus]
MRVTRSIIAILSFISFTAQAQSDYQIVFPTHYNWNKFKEGEEKSLDLSVAGPMDDRRFIFNITQGKQVGMELDSSGHFSWTPDYSLVDRIERVKIFQILIEAQSDSGDFARRTMDLVVSHTNRPPVVNELKPFYIQYNTNNKYQIENTVVFDEDNDPLVFIPSIEELPQGMNISSRGEVTWSPSYTQFKKLQEKPMFISFSVEDQPSKSQSQGRIKLVPTQLDLPPALTLVPKTTEIEIKEKETVDIGFYLSDPNGDEDIETFDFLSNNPQIRKQNLVKNTANQYEFIWTPDYDFVQDPDEFVTFYIDFFVIDKSKLRSVQRVNFKVNNAINEAEIDRKTFALYKGTLIRGWELLEQLKEKEEVLKKAYSKAKKGKKNRSVVNASLGATTGLSSVFAKGNENLQRTISTVGGTTVLTIGTLEATEVVGKSMKDIIDRLNYVIEKKNEIQTKGDIFARDYALKSSRRSTNFKRSMDDFLNAMNLKGLVALELNANWESKKKATDQNIQKTFKDYSAEDEQF